MTCVTTVHEGGWSMCVREGVELSKETVCVHDIVQSCEHMAGVHASMITQCVIHKPTITYTYNVL